MAAIDNEKIELLEKQLQEQQQEIEELKAQVASGQGSVSPAQFEALQNQVYETQATVKDATKPQDVVVKFGRRNPYQHEKTVPVISSADGRYTLQPFLLVQGDWASYSKGQPLSLPGTLNLKSSGENLRRARVGFQGIFAKDFSYSFIADFGGAGGDETYQAFAGPNTGTTKNANGASLTPFTASTGAGTGARIYNAWVAYKGFLDPFTLRIGIMAPPSNLGDATESGDLLFNERPSPSQLSRGLAADDSREAAGFIGYRDGWYASIFLTGDTFGKAPLIAPATTYGGGQEAIVGRVAIRPWYDTETNLNLHVGGSFSYVIHPAEATNTANPGGVTTYPITFSDRPELRVDNVTFINTGAINATNAYVAGVEAAASYGPVFIQGENFWYGITRNNPVPGVTDPRFSGWYVEGSWVFTGEVRPYDPSAGSFKHPSPDAPFDPFHGDWGAWEVAGRYSTARFGYDITATNVADRVFGGTQYIASAGLNFYPNDVLRFVLDWQTVTLRNIGALHDDGHYETFSFRGQIAF